MEYWYSLGFTAFKISRLPQLKIETRENGNLNVEPLLSWSSLQKRVILPFFVAKRGRLLVVSSEPAELRAGGQLPLTHILAVLVSKPFPFKELVFLLVPPDF